jgi:hypothetical protein
MVRPESDESHELTNFALGLATEVASAAHAATAPIEITPATAATMRLLGLVIGYSFPGGQRFRGRTLRFPPADLATGEHLRLTGPTGHPTPRLLKP